MKLFALIFSTLLMSSVTASAGQTCQPVPSLGLCAYLEFAEPAKTKVNSPFLLTFTKLEAAAEKAGELIFPSTDIQVDLWMPDMGHGSSPVKISKYPVTSALYVDKVNFMMGGLWHIRIKVMKAGSTTPVETIVVPIQL